MKHTYAILGAGMQGTAAAFDLAKFSDATQIKLGDANFEQAQRSASRVNGLIGNDLCQPHQVDGLSLDSLGAFLDGVDVLLSCVPYWMHPKIAEVAIAKGVSMCDLGGNTEVTLETLKLDASAQSAGVTLVPDCGLAPGLVNSLGMYLIESLDETESVKLYCGVLPQNPKPPFNYKLTFNLEGLVTEYDYEAVVLRDGEIAMVETLSELESLHVPELGTMEAFTTSGGTSTAPYTLQGKVRNYEYKTIRFPGHCERMRIFKDFGFWSEDHLDVRGVSVRPKDVFNRVFGPALAKIQDHDQCAIKGVATGTKGGKAVRFEVDIFDRQDTVTGFTSMERLTGFSLSIIAQSIAKGSMPKGVLRYETAMSGHDFVAELGRRGIQISERSEGV